MTLAISPTSVAYSLPDRRALDWLAVARFAEVAVMLVALLASGWLSDAPSAWLWALPLLVLIVNAFFWWRVSYGRLRGAAELGLFLLFDCLALWWLLWELGGASNPFVSFLLVPVALASVVLPRHLAVALTAFCVVIYSALLWHYLDIGSPDHVPVIFQKHVIGMWLNFLFAAVLLCACLLVLVAKLRQRDTEITQQREKQLRDDAILAVASLAADTAHTLNTPLGTIALLSESLADNPSLDVEAQGDVETISEQARLCGQQLQQIASMANQQDSHEISLVNYAKTLMHHWRMRRNDVPTVVQGVAALPARLLCEKPLLNQALLNLLDNAADASQQAGHDDIVIDWQLLERRGQSYLRVTIENHGYLPDVERLNHDPVTSSKPRGLGLGLMLARANILRLDGRLLFRQGSGQGRVSAEVTIPWRSLTRTGESL